MPINDDLFRMAKIGKFADILNTAAENFSHNILGFTSNVGLNLSSDSCTVSLSSLFQYATAYLYRLSKLEINPNYTAILSLRDTIIRVHDELTRFMPGAPLMQQKLDLLDKIERSKWMFYREPYSFDFYWTEAVGDKAVEITISNIKQNGFYLNWDYRNYSGFDKLPDELKSILEAQGMQSAILRFYAV